MTGNILCQGITSPIPCGTILMTSRVPAVLRRVPSAVASAADARRPSEHAIDVRRLRYENGP